MSDVGQFIFRFLLFIAVHSVCAIPSLKKRFVEQSQHLRRYYRLYYNLISLMLFGWVMAAFRHPTILYVAPGVWSLVLYLLQIIFLLLLADCVRHTGVAAFLGFTGVSQDSLQAPRLVTTGWYRVVRHPLYLLSMLFLLSNPVVSTRGILLTLISAVYFVVGALLEESRLLLEFGDEYRMYQRTVPFIIPRIFTRQVPV